MPVRLVEIHLPLEKRDEARDMLKEHPVMGAWDEKVAEDRAVIKTIVSSDHIQTVLDALEDHLADIDDYKVVVFSLEAVLPRSGPGEEAEPEEPSPGTQKKQSHISREELYEDISESVKLNWSYVLLVVLSTVVAAIGLYRDDMSIVIGAMVIAPLLHPNIALGLATTLADLSLARNAAKVLFVGIAVAVIASIIIGMFFAFDPSVSAIEKRTRAEMGDVALSLAAGAAASLSFTTAMLPALLGVAVALALLPPMVTFGLLIGGGEFELALKALLLVSVNIICINLSSVAVFLAQGIFPKAWQEAKKAKRAALMAALLWGSLLAALIVLILII